MPISKQYGAPDPPPGTPQVSAGYGDPSKQAPQVKQQDPSPPTGIVEQFHKNAAVDTRPEDIHHRLGPNPNQAAAGNHNHRGADSVLLLDGVVLTGSRGGNAALASVISALVQLGAKDTTTA